MTMGLATNGPVLDTSVAMCASITPKLSAVPMAEMALAAAREEDS